MKKLKLISLILALVMVLGLFAGCGTEKPTDTTTEAKTTDGGSTTTVDNTQYDYGTVHGVTWTWGGQADKADSTAVQREEERNAMYYVNTGNTRECVAFTYNFDTVGALFEGGQMPTVFYVPATEPTRLVSAGWGRDISACVEAVGINLDDFNQAVLETHMDENGGVYGLPYSAYSLGMAANGALYKEAGIVDENGEPKAPETWDEVIEQSLEIRQKTGKGGLALHAASRNGGWHFTNIAWNFGADLCVWNEETGKYESGINSQATIDALAWFQKACHSGAVVNTPATDDFSATTSLMKSGEASLIIAASDVAGGLTGDDNDGMPAEDVYYFPMPAGPNGDRYSLMGGATYWFSSSATDEQVIAALEYLMHYGYWVQEWTDDAKQSDLTSWKDALAKHKIVLPVFPVYNAPYTEERNALLFETMGELYDFEKQLGVVWEFAEIPGVLHPEEECDCQNLYQELCNIMQEVANDPNADCAALVEKADINYASLLEVAQS